MEDTIEKKIPIDQTYARGKLEFIILYRNHCKAHLEKADNVMSDLTNMASSRLLLSGIGVGKLDQHLFTFGMCSTVYEHNLLPERIKIRLLGRDTAEKNSSPLTISSKLHRDFIKMKLRIISALIKVSGWVATGHCNFQQFISNKEYSNISFI